MVLCFVEVVSGGYAMGRQCGLPQFYQVCLCFLFNLLLSQMYDFTPMIFTVPLWGSASRFDVRCGYMVTPID